MKTLSWKANRRIRRDYSRKQFKNYMFRARRERHTSLKARLLAALIVIFIGFGIGAQFSPIFAITDIQISGTEDVSSDEVKAMLREKMNRERRFFIFPQWNIIFFNAKEAVRAVSGRYPAIAEVSTDRTLARTLYVRIREHEKVAVLVGSTEAFYLGEGGEKLSAIGEAYLIREGGATGTTARITGIQDEAKKQLPVLFGETEGETPAALVAAVRMLAQELPKHGVPLAAFQYEAADGRLIATTSDGWSVYFDPATEKLADQVESLAAVLSKEIKNSKDIDYIDLRFENRVYYK